MSMPPSRASVGLAGTPNGPGWRERPIRWIVDDATDFVDREIRRERRYDGIVLDPPSYGHGPDGRPWRLAEDLPALLDRCRAVLAPDGFVLLTAHTPGFEADRLGSELARAFEFDGASIETGGLELRTTDGRHLELGAFARAGGGAS